MTHIRGLQHPAHKTQQNLLSLYLIHLYGTHLFGLRMQAFPMHLVWCSGTREGVAVLVGLCRLVVPVHDVGVWVGGAGREVGG
jgi:hypothetical protein